MTLSAESFSPSPYSQTYLAALRLKLVKLTGTETSGDIVVTVKLEVEAGKGLSSSEQEDNPIKAPSPSTNE